MQAAARADAVDRDHHRHLKDTTRHEAELAVQAGSARGAVRGEQAGIRPGAERPAVAGQDDATQVLAPRQVHPGRRELVHQGGRQGVEPFGPVKYDTGGVLFDGKRLRHAAPPTGELIGKTTRYSFF